MTFFASTFVGLEFVLGLLLVTAGTYLALTIASFVLFGGAKIVGQGSMEFLVSLGIPCVLSSAFAVLLTSILLFIGSWLLRDAIPFLFVALIAIIGLVMSPTIAMYFTLPKSIFIVGYYAWAAVLYLMVTAYLTRRCNARKVAGFSNV
jgi:hypothetical protein